MTQNEIECFMLMESIKNKYFKDIRMPVSFHIQKELGPDCVYGRVLFLAGGEVEIWLYYNDDRVLEHRFRWGLVPIVAHELAHIINPVEPDLILKQRLPENLVKAWDVMKESGQVKCSFGAE